LNVTTEITNHIAELWLDNPPVNAFSRAGWDVLTRTLAEVGARRDVRCVLLAARGRGFCAGVDIKELAGDPDLIPRVNAACRRALSAVHDCPVPVVAACHGFVLGGGAGLAAACDLVLASDDASFGLPEIDRGALGGASHLMRLFPTQKVRRMLFTGEPVSATEAYRLGALEWLGPREQLLPEARRLARTIADKSPAALRLAKECMNGIELLDVAKSYRYEQGFTLELYASPDSQEARAAFLEGREPEYADETS